MPRKKKKPVPIVVLDEAHRALKIFPELQGVHDYEHMIAILNEFGDAHDVLTLYGEAYQVMFGTAWEQAGKQIFEFDVELAHALAHQTDLAVASGTLKRLPFRCAYIRLPKTLRHKGEEVDGFFARMQGEEIELLICHTSVREFGQTILHLGAKTFEESDAMVPRVDGLIYEEPKDYRGMSVCVQALLYLCAQNADIARTSPTPSTTGHQQRNAKQAKKLPVQSWSVGVRVGQTIKANRRRYERTGTGTQHGTHARPRPHLRSGHWSHFWTGKRDSADRERVLKWIEPVYINANSPDDLPTTIHKVEK